MGNTGVKIITQLKEVWSTDHTHETGNVKPNSEFLTSGASDPDYEPPYVDLAACPVTFDTFCPAEVIISSVTTHDGIRYEFALPNSTALNPGIRRIRVRARQGIGGAYEGTTDIYLLPSLPVNYFSGTITGLVDTGNPDYPAYTLEIQYLDSGGFVLRTCTTSAIDITV